MDMFLVAKMVADWNGLSGKIEPTILDQGERSTAALVKVLTLLGHKAWKHMSYTFMLVGEDWQMLRILTRTALQGTEHEGYYIVTGNVDHWHQAFRTLCSAGEDKQIRGVMNAIMLYMERDGIKFPSAKLELRDRSFEVQ